jgi:4-amino-4-deoxy-L-arabinose transferase-like glycosyltransferase
MPAFFTHNRKAPGYILAALLFVIAAVNVFTGLGTERIHSWDEAHHGVSACEMMESGNYIVNTYDYIVDYWNVKPVLSFYNNIIGMKLFGRNIFGFRFLSAVSYMVIAGLMFLLLWHEAGMAAALVGTATFAVLPTNWVHSFRTGDPDATYMMFCFAAFVSLWFSARKGRGPMLALSTFCLGMAFLIKSFHVGIHGVLLLVFVAFHWKRYSWRDLLLAVAAGAAPVLVWAGFRYHADGLEFFQSMVELDLLGRMNEKHLDEHQGMVWYEYFMALNHYLIVIPLAITAAAIGAGFFLRGKKCFSSPEYALGRWSLLFFLISFVAFSLCRVRLKWYIFPSLLYFSVAFGMLFHFACRWIREESERKRAVFFFLPPLAIIVGCLVWLGIGEGKAIRNIVKMEVQTDVLTDDHGGDAYRGRTFYSVNQDGVRDAPHQKFMLVIRFLDAKIVRKSVDEYKAAADDAFLVCRFEETKTEKLRPLAEEFAARHSLKLIRYANGQALYRR